MTNAPVNRTAAFELARRLGDLAREARAQGDEARFERLMGEANAWNAIATYGAANAVERVSRLYEAQS